MPPLEPVEAVTVRVAPVPVTDVMDAPVRPPPLTRVKFAFVTPTTFSENVTRNATLVGGRWGGVDPG